MRDRGGDPLRTPSEFLNESRVTAIGLCLYLAGMARSIPPKRANGSTYPRLLVLDDVILIMQPRWKLGIETVAAAALGGCAACFLVRLLPGQIAAEVVAAIGGTLAVSGSLLGFAVSWLGQSRTMLRDIDYDSAGELFTNLAQIQRELIIRWGVVLACSLFVVGVAAVLKGVAAGQPPPSLGAGFRYGLAATVSALTVG